MLKYDIASRELITTMMHRYENKRKLFSAFIQLPNQVTTSNEKNWETEKEFVAIYIYDEVINELSANDIRP